MKELSLHILDIVQNSISAGANLIKIYINQDIEKNIYSIFIEDNGIGMDEDMANKVTDPFYTTRTVRKVGLGVPLIKAATERCNGKFEIQSEVGKGTKVYCEFQNNHIDRAPLGKIEDTIMTILNNSSEFDLVYMHTYNNKKFNLDTREIKYLLDENTLNNPEILIWIRDYIRENLLELK